MPTDSAFRLSTYLSLGLACLCLAYSEWDLLPDVTVLTLVVLMMLVVSYHLEGKYTLNIRQANRMGFVIFLLAGVWLAWHYSRPDALIHTLPWPAGLLPYLGPLLMVLMPAKLFRPKHEGDWWAMQGIGAVAVALACAMSDDAVFAGLLAAYTVVMVWAAAQFYLRRWAGAVPPVPGYPADPPPVVVGSGPGSGALRPVGLWAAAAVVIALPLFFLTPRSPGAKWQLTSRSETGYTGENTVDLGTTGTLRVNREIAFEVTATYPDGRPKIDLDPDTRWRGEGFTRYAEGKWDYPTSRSGPFVTRLSSGERGVLADLGPGQYYLDFRPGPDLARPVLADPVIWEYFQPAPVGTIGLGRFRPWLSVGDGSFVAPGDTTPHRLPISRLLPPYRQVARPIPDPDIGPGYEMPSALSQRTLASILGNEKPADLLTPMRELKSLPGIEDWGQQLLANLNRSGRVAPEATEFDPIRNRRVVREDSYEAVGRAFCDHFAKSGEFNYSLDLPREDRNLDPVEDFLRHTKVGHCQRFASALALTLRGVGVPAVLVVGFKGHEQDEPGRYVVRQDRAHAWVAVPIPRPAPPGLLPAETRDGQRIAGPNRLWHWLSLDPSPLTEAEAPGGEAGLGQWIDKVRTVGHTFYADFIIGYDLERRNRMIARVGDHFATNWGWYAGPVVAVVGLIGVVLFVRRISREVIGPHVDPGTGVAWYDSVLAELARRGYPIRHGQTPGEYARLAGAFLRANARTAEVADVPGEATAALYELRYACRPLAPEREAELRAAAARLAAAPHPEDDRA